MTDPDLNPCNEPGMIKDLNVDPPSPYCREANVQDTSGTIDHQPYPSSQREISGADLSWLEESTQSKSGYGASALCDPQQTGHIINEQGMSSPNFNTIYRDAQSIRGADEAMKQMFSDIIVYDDAGKVHQVPIIWATQERAVAWALQENTRKDESLVVDRIRLPLMSIVSSSYEFNQNRYVYHKAIDYLRNYRDNWKPGFTVSERYQRDTIFGISRGIPLDIGYTLYVWTLYSEDMNQIMTQILTKFSPLAYIRVKGIPWEIGVKLTQISKNGDLEPGDKASPVHKLEFGMTAESFVCQPIVRKKAVLKTRVEITDALNDEDITEVLARLEQSVKELEE